MDRNGAEDLPDTAMASGSDAGEPGEHLGPADLQPDERRLLSALERDVQPPQPGEGDDALEDDELVAQAAEDERPLPAEGGVQDDGLSPRFSSED
jgi:hypothetical protein